MHLIAAETHGWLSMRGGSWVISRLVDSLSIYLSFARCAVVLGRRLSNHRSEAYLHAADIRCVCIQYLPANDILRNLIMNLRYHSIEHGPSAEPEILTRAFPRKQARNSKRSGSQAM